ncbi:hypothetical protein HDU85_003251 [Gaertneriomyces sp. JEL0708]|nr:hypothetical protein HDU85_003251 [Gaertneriomyces sp. JEL0708]
MVILGSTTAARSLRGTTHVLITPKGRAVHAGRATVAGTERYAGLFPDLSFARVPKTGWKVSTAGFGGFRVRHDMELHRNALSMALDNGVNIIDTSAHFENGMSEQLIGSVIGDKIKRQELDRESLVLVTKAGYISGQNYRPPFPYTHTMVNAKMAHSIAPEFLEQELSSSLLRLSVETIDCYMLNSPERMMLGEKQYSEQQVYDLIGRASLHLDKEVKRGRIASWGITSSTMATANAMMSVSLSRIISAILNAGANLDNFAAVEYPFNVFENDAYRSTGLPSLMETCRDQRLFQLLHRPLYAIVNGQIRLLSTHLGVTAEEEPEVMRDLTASFEAVQQLENQIPELVGDTTRDVDIMAKFVWGQVLSDNLTRLSQNFFAARHYIDHQIRPALSADLVSLWNLASETQTSNAGLLSQWADDYNEQFNKLLETFLKLCSVTLLKSNATLATTIAGVASWHPEADVSLDDPLAPLVLQVARSAVMHESTATNGNPETDSAGCVLVGMRKPEYVEEMVGEMEKGRILPKEVVTGILDYAHAQS